MKHLIAVGANLPRDDGMSPRGTCEAAARAVADIPAVTAARRSRWFSSAALPRSEQPRFVNGMVMVQADISPGDLLGHLQAIEAAAGRRRAGPDAARILDLDIIDSGGQTRASPDPVLPHPRAHLRAFVLLPLRDLAPQWRHPTLDLDVAALLASLPAQDIYPL